MAKKGKKLIPKTQSTINAYQKRMEWMKTNYGKTHKQIIKSGEIYLELLQKKDTVNKGGWCTSAIQYFRQEAGLERYPRSFAKENGVTNIGQKRLTAKKKKKANKKSSKMDISESESSSSDDESSMDESSSSSSDMRSPVKKKRKTRSRIKKTEKKGITREERAHLHDLANLVKVFQINNGEVEFDNRFETPVPIPGQYMPSNPRRNRMAWNATAKLAENDGHFEDYDETMSGGCITFIANLVEKKLKKDLPEDYVIDRIHVACDLLPERICEPGQLPTASAEWFLTATADHKKHLTNITNGKKTLDKEIARALKAIHKQYNKQQEIPQAQACAKVANFFMEKLQATF